VALLQQLVVHQQQLVRLMRENNRLKKEHNANRYRYTTSHATTTRDPAFKGHLIQVRHWRPACCFK